jgi:hypothetical protein
MGVHILFLIMLIDDNLGVVGVLGVLVVLGVLGVLGVLAVYFLLVMVF